MDDAPKPQTSGFLGKVVKNITNDLRETGTTLKGEVLRAPKVSSSAAPPPAQTPPVAPRQDGLVMEVKGDVIGTNEWRPNRLLIYEDRVEEVNPGLMRRQTHQTIRYRQIAQVAAKKGLRWSTLVVETVGGGSITVHGLRWDKAERARVEIDSRVAAAWAPRSEESMAPAPSGLSTDLLASESSEIAAS